MGSRCCAVPGRSHFESSQQHDEGDEGNEAGEHHCQEQACQGHRVPRAQDEDHWWAHEVGPVQEQARQDREPEGELRREEAVLEHARALALCAHEGAEGLERQGLCGVQRQDRAGPGLVREGEVLLLEVSDCQWGAIPTAAASLERWRPLWGVGLSRCLCERGAPFLLWLGASVVGASVPTDREKPCTPPVWK